VFAPLLVFCFVDNSNIFTVTYELGNEHPIPGAQYEFVATPVGANNLISASSNVTINLRKCIAAFFWDQNAIQSIICF